MLLYMYFPAFSHVPKNVSFHRTPSAALARTFGKSRGADVLPRCDRKHGCALEIVPVTQVFAFGCASDHMH